MLYPFWAMQRQPWRINWNDIENAVRRWNRRNQKSWRWKARRVFVNSERSWPLRGCYLRERITFRQHRQSYIRAHRWNAGWGAASHNVRGRWIRRGWSRRDARKTKVAKIRIINAWAGLWDESKEDLGQEGREITSLRIWSWWGLCWFNWRGKRYAWPIEIQIQLTDGELQNKMG